jgi:hypothetical protein
MYFSLKKYFYSYLLFKITKYYYQALRELSFNMQIDLYCIGIKLKKTFLRFYQKLKNQINGYKTLNKHPIVKQRSYYCLAQ